LEVDFGSFCSAAPLRIEAWTATVAGLYEAKPTREHTCARRSSVGEHEHEPIFRLAQRFRAGVEGSISFLKRLLGLSRCYTKECHHFQSTVGATIFTHNLLILGRY
jgi:hypothetical protein